MKTLPILLSAFLLTSCGILDHSKEDELSRITETVLKKGEGVDIEVKPILVEKN